MAAVGLILLKLIDSRLAALAGQLQEPVLVHFPAYCCGQAEITDHI
jgi:hypothetical protein